MCILEIYYGGWLGVICFYNISNQFHVFCFIEPPVGGGRSSRSEIPPKNKRSSRDETGPQNNDDTLRGEDNADHNRPSRGVGIESRSERSPSMMSLRSEGTRGRIPTTRNKARGRYLLHCLYFNN